MDICWRWNNERFMMIRLHAMTWHDLDTPSRIWWILLNDINSTPRVTYEPLIKDAEADLIATPNFYLFLLSFLIVQSILGFFIDQTFWTILSLNILLSSSFRFIFASKECLKSRFCWGIRKNVDGSNQCGHQLDTDSCQNKVQTYQLNENNSNWGV